MSRILGEGKGSRTDKYRQFVNGGELASSENRRGKGKTNIPLRGKNAYLRDLGYTAEQRGDDLGRAQRTIERWDKEDRDAEFAEMNLPASEILGAIAAYIEELKSRANYGDSYRPMNYSKLDFGPREQFVIDVVRRKEPQLAGLEEEFNVETERKKKDKLVEEISKMLQQYVQI